MHRKYVVSLIFFLFFGFLITVPPIEAVHKYGERNLACGETQDLERSALFEENLNLVVWKCASTSIPENSRVKEDSNSRLLSGFETGVPASIQLCTAILPGRSLREVRWPWVKSSLGNGFSSRSKRKRIVYM